MHPLYEQVIGRVHDQINGRCEEQIQRVLAACMERTGFRCTLDQIRHPVARVQSVVAIQACVQRAQEGD